MNDDLKELLVVLAGIIGVFIFINFVVFCGRYFPWLDDKFKQTFEVSK